ncbi:signal sequence receptor alpha subunit [Beauveria bassiana ARSEF 2860]|uniref:Signal sequence receptor alpha subunit n=1 Tax=Beauveria bassiana (strain ARSEF 2860) TaxID=655819 RepID=J4W007_BEAB2|nr:signal sequence receptor alpha subunit [Beauveria bassiana ARSEF 2860]EJP63860.1 signal sequence receptor alpha subunit [Beauveria bassiana ARSEF 2860]
MINTLPCPAWVFSPESNAHRAKDRSWFGDDYQTISSALSLQRRSSDSLQLEVIGIGTVELPVKRRPDARGAQSHGVLRLRNVLHVPSGLCNVVGGKALLAAGYLVRRGPGGGGIREISDKNGGAAVAYLHQPNARLGGRHLQVRLSGPPIGPRLGPSPFVKGESYSFSARWHDDAREQVMRTLAKLKPVVASPKPAMVKSKPGAVAKTPAQSPAATGAAVAANPPLAFTEEEREWMRRHHGSVYLFLRVCGLKGSSAEDAQAARRVIRMRMAGGSPHSGGGGGVSSSVSVVVAEAERCFGKEELAWVRERYGDGLSFMLHLQHLLLDIIIAPTRLRASLVNNFDSASCSNERLKRRRADSASDSQARKRTQPEDLMCPAKLPSACGMVLTLHCANHLCRPYTRLIIVYSVAKDRAWFCGDYRPISSFITHQPEGSVIGIGTVRLPVKISPDPGNREHDFITLRNVLHAPDSLCNMIGLPFHKDYDLIFRPRLPVNEFRLPDGTPAGFFKNERFCQLRLSGPPIGPHVGPSPFKPDCSYWLRGDWPDEERDKWLLPKKRQDHLDRPSAEERRWLKKHYGNEYKFLAAHGLRIRDERDRQEGLEIMRDFMREVSVDSLGGSGREGERVSPEERKWLKKHYGNEFKFLTMHGLRMHDDQDRQEGLSIIRVLMESDRLYA